MNKKLRTEENIYLEKGNLNKLPIFKKHIPQTSQNTKSNTYFYYYSLLA